MNAEDKLLCAPVCKLKELNNLFIELTAKNCNQRCKQCYIDFPISRKEKDFIPIEKVKQTIEQTMDENLNCIYLTGAEPMTHPDFNNILRLCLTFIITTGIELRRSTLNLHFNIITMPTWAVM